MWKLTRCAHERFTHCTFTHYSHYSHYSHVALVACRASTTHTRNQNRSVTRIMDMHWCTGMFYIIFVICAQIQLIIFRLMLKNALCRRNGIQWSRPWDQMFRVPTAADRNRARNPLQWTAVNLLDLNQTGNRTYHAVCYSTISQSKLLG